MIRAHLWATTEQVGKKGADIVFQCDESNCIKPAHT